MNSPSKTLFPPPRLEWKDEEFFQRFFVEFHEIVPVVLDHNTGECRVEESIRDGFVDESHAGY